MKNVRAVILAGGRGTRLGPITDGMPKPLVPVAGKPVLSHILSLLASHGIRDAVVTLGYRAEDIRDYLDENGTEGIRLRIREEEKPLGTAGALRELAGFLSDPFLVISGDAMTDFDLTAALGYHREHGGVGTILTSESDTPHEFGVIEKDETGKIVRFVEKPPRGLYASAEINAGVYILDKSVLSLVKRDGETDFSRDLFPALLGSLYACRLPGYWCDVGTPKSYLSCNRDALAGKIRSIPAAPFRRGAGGAPGPHVQITWGSVIGRGVTLGAGSEIRGAILMDGVTVGESAVVESAVLCEGVRVGTGAVIRSEAVIGKNAVIGDGVTIERGEMIPAEAAVFSAENGRNEREKAKKATEKQ